MKPSKLKPGKRILLTGSDQRQREAVFIRRHPAQGGRKAINIIRVPDFAGLEGPNDDGTCTISDYDFSRKTQPLNAA